MRYYRKPARILDPLEARQRVKDFREDLKYTPELIPVFAELRAVIVKHFYAGSNSSARMDEVYGQDADALLLELVLKKFLIFD